LTEMSPLWWHIYMTKRCGPLILNVHLLLIGATISLWPIAGTGQAGALIEFPNVSEQSQPTRLLGYLTHPDGTGPFPAVVVLHGCSGFSAASEGIADRLKLLGYRSADGRQPWPSS